MNKVFLIGRNTRDLELRTSNSGTKMVSFSIVTDNGKDKDGNKRDADFIECVAWENQAETLAKYLKKGDLVSIIGKVRTDKYQNEKGENRYRTYVLVREFEFLQSKPKDNFFPEEPDYIKAKSQSQILADVMQAPSSQTKDPFADFGQEADLSSLEPNEVQLEPNELPF